MFLVLKEILYFEHIVFIRYSILVDIPQYFNFIDGLIYLIFVVVDHFETNQCVQVDILAHLRFGECSAA